MTEAHLLEDLTTYSDHKGREFHFIELMDSRHLFSWQLTTECGVNKATARKLDVCQVPVDQLQALEIWDGLSESIQEEVKNSEDGLKNVVHTRMEKARKGRKKKYENMPREYECITCHAKKPIPPSIVNQRLEKKGMLLDDFIKQFQCQVCNPTRGKKSNPKYKGLPEELVCKCGSKVKANYSYLEKKAKEKGTTVDALAKSYQCQKCNPTIGRKKGTKNKKAKKRKAKK